MQEVEDVSLIDAEVRLQAIDHVQAETNAGAFDQRTLGHLPTQNLPENVVPHHGGGLFPGRWGVNALLCHTGKNTLPTGIVQVGAAGRWDVHGGRTHAQRWGGQGGQEGWRAFYYQPVIALKRRRI